jgi:hypothetical protein
MYFARKIARAWLSMVCHGLPRKRLLFWRARNLALILVHYHAAGRPGKFVARRCGCERVKRA